MIAVHVVEEAGSPLGRAGRGANADRTGAGQRHLGPADVRHRQTWSGSAAPGREGFRAPRQPAPPRSAAKKSCMAEADAQDRAGRPRPRDDRVAQSGRPQIGGPGRSCRRPARRSRSARRTSAGSALKRGGVAARLQRPDHAPQVVDTVVDDDDHRAPLVEGTPRTRGSRVTASPTSARATALKVASTMWCGFSPRIRSR